MSHPPLHCPSCSHVLSEPRKELQCQSCRETYRVHNGIPELVARRFLDDFKATERHFHDELSVSVQTGSIRGRTSSFHHHFKRPLLSLPPAASVLEVACGTRADGIEVALAGKDVTCLDISLEAVEHARHLARNNGVDSIRFLVADGEHLPFADRCFDASFVAASFHHFPNQIRALREMRRVTKPGGYVIWGVEPAAWPYKTIFKLLTPVKRYIRRRRSRQYDSPADDTTEGYTEEQIRELFQRANLTITDVTPVKLLSELYDSSIRMFGRVLKKPWQPWTTLDHVLSRIDDLLVHLPGIKKIFWHWNVISVVPPDP